MREEINMEDIRSYRDHQDERRFESENPVEWELATEDDVPYHIPRD
jgi:hypothetical protein